MIDMPRPDANNHALFILHLPVVLTITRSSVHLKARKKILSTGRGK
jgi:hypothetical protein